LSIFFKSRVAVKYSERHQLDIIEVYEKVKMVAKMAAKMGCFLKNDQYLSSICFVLSVYSKPFNVDSVRRHVGVKNIIDAGLF